MSTTTSKYIFGVRVYLDTVETQDTDIGLYNTNFGDATSRFDISNTSGSIYRYTYDGTGTAPAFVNNGLRVGDNIVINSSTFNSANNGTFKTITVAATYFEITNAAGVAENDKVLSAASSLRGVFCFRWITNSSTNTTETWKAGMLLDKGIGNIGQSADFSIGGNLLKVRGLEVSVKNAISTTPFWKKLVDAGISLKGLIAEVVEFDTEVDDVGTRANEKIIFRGACLAPSGWTEAKYTIPIENTHYKRIANITEKVDNDAANGNYPNADADAVGIPIPVTFGQLDNGSALDPATTLSTPAAMVRTANKQTIFELGNAGSFIPLYTGSQIEIRVPLGNTSVFPIVNTTTALPVLSYQIKLSAAYGFYWQTNIAGVITPWNVGSGVHAIADFVGKYLHCIEGDGSGEYREITAATVDCDADIAVINLTVADYYTTYMKGNTTATWPSTAGEITIGGTQSWCTIEGLSRQYVADTWPCKSFLDEDGAEINQELDLYVYDSDKSIAVSGTVSGSDVTGTGILTETRQEFRKVPSYIFNDSTSENNLVDVDVKLFNGDTDNVDSYIIRPVKNITFPDSSFINASTKVCPYTHSVWDSASTVLGTFRAKGIFSDMALSGTNVPSAAEVAEITDLHYRAPLASGYLAASSNSSGVVYFAIEFELPDYPTNFTFDNVYIMSMLNFDVTAAPLLDGSGFQNIGFYLRRFMGTSMVAKEFTGVKQTSPTAVSRTDINLEDVPDFFYLDAENPATGSKNFYVSESTSQTPAVSTRDANLYGLTNYLISNISDKKSYESIYKVGIIIKGTTGNGGSTVYAYINKLGIIFQKSVSIKDAIYTPIKGRTFYKPIGSTYSGVTAYTTQKIISVSLSAPPASPDTYDTYVVAPTGTGAWAGLDNYVTFWNSAAWQSGAPSAGWYVTLTDDTQYIYNGTSWELARKKVSVSLLLDTDDLMQSPIDIYEHVCRLQDWKETGDTEDFGKEYSANALINTAATEGGFDWIGLDDRRAFKAARQILDYDDCSTDKVKESICKQYELCGFQDSDGKECVNTIRKIDTTPDVSITLSDIINGTIDAVEEVSPANIFCEPEVNYNMNYGSGKFDGHITIKSVEQDTFAASYVTGYKGADAQHLWTLCHTLYTQYRMKTPAPKERTDCPWIRTEQEAKQYLIDWLEFMGSYINDTSEYKIAIKKRITFKVSYKTAMTIGAAHTPWFVSMHLDLTLPHQTANVSTQGIIEEITFDLNAQTATVKAILYDVSSEIQYYVKNAFKSYADIGDDDWKNAFLTKAQAPLDNENDVKQSF